MSKTDVQAAREALASRDWSGAQVVTPTGPPTIVHSARLPVEYSKALEAEAARRGSNPSRLMAELVVEKLRELGGSGDVEIREARQALDVLSRVVAQVEAA